MNFQKNQKVVFVGSPSRPYGQASRVTQGSIGTVEDHIPMKTKFGPKIAVYFRDENNPSIKSMFVYEDEIKPASSSINQESICIRLGSLRKIIKETLSETRPWGREIGAEWDEGPEDDRHNRTAFLRKKAKKRTVKKAPTPLPSPTPASDNKKEVSETGAYYGKTASAQGVPLGGNGQKSPNLTSACGDPKCQGCEEDPPLERDEDPVMCWCGDRDCSHYE